MLRNRQVELLPVSITPEPSRPTPTPVTLEPDARAALMANQQSVIGAGLVIVGEITGAEPLKSLFIEGAVQGKINLPGVPLTVGPGGRVNAEVIARDIVISGQIKGNVKASDRIEIRTGGSLIGDASAPRIVVEDGAFVEGAINIVRSAAPKSMEEPARLADVKPLETDPPTALLIRPETYNPQPFTSFRSA